MRAAASIISICLTLFLLNSGCSKEEEPLAPIQKPKVVKAIQKPGPEKAKTPLASETPTAQPEEKEGEGSKETALEKTPPTKPEEKTREKERSKGEEAGYYIAKEGDTLTSIAAREDVFGDSLKWPILCRLNSDKVGPLQGGADFLERKLPVGTRLKIVTPDEAKDNLKKRANSPWVVNVISSLDKGEVIPATIRLVKEGYPAYIARAEVKGKEYMRLRVGFFAERAEADRTGKEIKAMLNLPDSWTTRAEKEELEIFGRY